MAICDFLNFFFNCAIIRLPYPLYCWLWCVSLRRYSFGWLHIKLSRADCISLHVCGKSSVHAFILWQHHRQTKTGSPILKNFNLVTRTGPDALAIFVPGNLAQDDSSSTKLAKRSKTVRVR